MGGLLTGVLLGGVRISTMKPLSPMGLNPDQPASFGYKVAWLTMATSDTERVARALRLQGSRAATWTEGSLLLISLRYSSRHRWQDVQFQEPGLGIIGSLDQAKPAG